MSLEFYKVVHLCGLAMLLLGLGGMLLGPKDGDSGRAPKILHGTGLLVMIIAGFGAMAKSHIMAPDSWPAWLILKMVAWFLLGALPPLVRHGTVPRPIAWLVCVLIVAGAAWLALLKPTFS